MKTIDAGATDVLIIDVVERRVSVESSASVVAIAEVNGSALTTRAARRLMDVYILDASI